ncbi:hypothetical protein LIER_39405 [Lithospermum erythrorhizon]|uniref:Uncharacterized protein n=1 Tax=Lithospermum erythrorhizon TaxID=34254 RepID=A0AAV3QGV5_LITER
MGVCLSKNNPGGSKGNGNQRSEAGNGANHAQIEYSKSPGFDGQLPQKALVSLKPVHNPNTILGEFQNKLINS